MMTFNYYLLIIFWLTFYHSLFQPKGTGNFDTTSMKNHININIEIMIGFLGIFLMRDTLFIKIDSAEPENTIFFCC